MTDPAAWRSPRSEGILEQLERARAFLQEAEASNDELFRFRHAIAAAYFACAAVEVMLTAAEKQEVPKNRVEVESLIAEVLPRYNLMKTIRIHDFHRFGLILRRGQVFVGGPIKLNAVGKKGSLASIALDPAGLIKSTTGASTIDEQRPLHASANNVLDEETDEWLEIEKVVAEFVAALPAAIQRYEDLRKMPNESGG